jgi:hypothetical protein
MCYVYVIFMFMSIIKLMSCGNEWIYILLVFDYHVMISNLVTIDRWEFKFRSHCRSVSCYKATQLFLKIHC